MVFVFLKSSLSISWTCLGGIGKDCRLDMDLQISFGMPVEKDAKDIWELIKNTRNLDLNSAYSYLILCKYFSESCIIAKTGGKVIGFISAFQTPNNPEFLFIWQVAVDSNYRRMGLAMNMFEHLLIRKKCQQIRYIEITVNPSNAAAYSLYHRLANRLDTSCEASICFPSCLFPGAQHEDEIMLRIGPLR